MRFFLIIFLTIITFSKVTILDKIDLSKFYFKGFNFSEISDLAYDKKKHILYMISDKGSLFTFKADFKNNKIHLKALKAFYLKDKNGKRLRGKKRDSEGLVLSKNGLYVSMERIPKVYKITKKAKVIQEIPLKFIKKYKQRSDNKSLEALTFSKKYGFLTAYEYAPKGRDKCDQLIFSTKGKIWNVKLEPFKNCAISSLEMIDKNNLLILERAYGGLFSDFVVTLKKYNLKTKEYQVIYQIKRSNNDDVQNYEGLSKVDKNLFLMVSDDNDMFLEKSLLILFKID